MYRVKGRITYKFSVKLKDGNIISLPDWVRLTNKKETEYARLKNRLMRNLAKLEKGVFNRETMEVIVPEDFPDLHIACAKHIFICEDLHTKELFATTYENTTDYKTRMELDLVNNKFTIDRKHWYTVREVEREIHVSI